MSTAEDLLETAENIATQRVHAYVTGQGVKPDPSVWLQMLSETTGVLLRVSSYYMEYDGSETVYVHSKNFTDEHEESSQYIESLLDYYKPEPVIKSNAPAWVGE